MVTIEQRRKTDKERRERWRKRKLTEGYKQIQLMITPEAQKVLKREKERTGEPFVQIINRGIINLEKSLPSITGKTETRPKTNVHPSISGKTKLRPRISEKIKPKHSVSDKTKAPPPEQLSLFIGSKN
ncbi:MAG: hypothetical protein BBJ57_00010 [Desulfobacterales bacterium PC51MH44]|nr:MAG: hypothetical protein BBJ57_00010 [Desulfobacterales bacterium PC51MH44]